MYIIDFIYQLYYNNQYEEFDNGGLYEAQKITIQKNHNAHEYFTRYLCDIVHR